MNENNIPLTENQQAGCTEDQQYKEKVPWKLGKQLRPKHIEKLNRLIADHQQRMFHVVDSYTKHD